MSNPTDRLQVLIRECLERWAVFSERYFWSVPDRPRLGCFGTGYNSWGVQTNQKYLGAMAVLATEAKSSRPKMTSNWRR